VSCQGDHGLDSTVTPFSFEVLWVMSLGDPRACAGAWGPWQLYFHEDTIYLDGEPVALHSWEHAEQLALQALDPHDAQHWLEILRRDCVERAAIREAYDA
jgi:hypothetical protein